MRGLWKKITWKILQSNFVSLSQVIDSSIHRYTYIREDLKWQPHISIINIYLKIKTAPGLCASKKTFLYFPLNLFSLLVSDCWHVSVCAHFKVAARSLKYQTMFVDQTEENQKCDFGELIFVFIIVGTSLKQINWNNK